MFAAPAFLLGLLAIGVPIWLHRVARANPTHHPFASLMLLRASETQRTARRTLRYWLLLALRILLLIALALAFAGPLLSERITPQVVSNARLHAIVLDTSLSMQQGERWQRAVEEAQKVLGSVGSADRVMLVTASGRRIDVVHEAVVASAAGALRATLADIKPGIGRLDYGLLMTTANSWLGAPRPHTQLHLISDLQQSASPLRFADLSPPADTEIVFHDVGAGTSPNTYIQNVTLTSKDTRTLDVNVATDATSVERREVVLSIDAKEIARKSVEVVATMVSTAANAAAGENSSGSAGAMPTQLDRGAAAIGFAKISFPDLTLEKGVHRIEVALEPNDGLPQDDRFRAVVEHADPKVLLVARSVDADDAAYFAAAIGSLTAPRLGTEQRSAEGLENAAWSGYSALVISNTSALSSGAAARIKDYVAAGGAVLATIDPALAERNDPLTGLRIGPARNEAARVGEIVTAHPILREASEWHRVRFLRQLPIEPAEGDKVLIRLENGLPLLLERTVGAGRMLVLAAPLDRSWNDLAIHPLFVRFIAEAAAYLTGHDASATSATVGTIMLTGLTATAGGQIFDPEGQRVLGLAETATADRLVPEQTGFYEVRSAEGLRWLAVNVDARESDLTRLPASVLQRWQALRAPEAPPTAAAAADKSEQAPAQRSLGTLLLFLAAGVLLLELLMANYYLAIRREVPQ
jgi:hypothetical protein